MKNEEAQRQTSQSKEHTMIVAFALAIVGALVLSSIEIAVRVHAHAHR